MPSFKVLLQLVNLDCKLVNVCQCPSHYAMSHMFILHSDTTIITTSSCLVTCKHCSKALSACLLSSHSYLFLLPNIWCIVENKLSHSSARTLQRIARQFLVLVFFLQHTD